MPSQVEEINDLPVLHFKNKIKIMDKETKIFSFKPPPFFDFGGDWNFELVLFTYRQAQNIINPKEQSLFLLKAKFLPTGHCQIDFSVITQGEKAELVQKENNEKWLLLWIYKQQGVKMILKPSIIILTLSMIILVSGKRAKDIYVSLPAKIIGYMLTQGVEVKIRDFDKIDEIGGLANWANDISLFLLKLKIEDYKNRLNQAIKKAEARAKIILAKISKIRENLVLPK